VAGIRGRCFFGDMVVDDDDDDDSHEQKLLILFAQQSGLYSSKLVRVYH
jgi:hypothetical protein